MIGREQFLSRKQSMRSPRNQPDVTRLPLVGGVWGLTTVPRPSAVFILVSSSGTYIAFSILKAICAGVGFGSGTETSFVHTWGKSRNVVDILCQISILVVLVVLHDCQLSLKDSHHGRSVIMALAHDGLVAQCIFTFIIYSFTFFRLEFMCCVHKRNATEVTKIWLK